MARFAPVGPLNLLEELWLVGSDPLGTYQLVIAPIVLKYDWAYANFFRKRHIDQFVILDNGVIEEGASLDLRNIAAAATVVGADVVVMPDTIDDGRMTSKQVQDAMTHWKTNGDLTDRFLTMGVVQGKSWEECWECASNLVQAGVDWLAVPRGLTPHLASRVPLTLALITEFGKPIHILGFSDNIKDDMMAAACHPLVQGIDAATPLWCPGSLPIHPPINEPKELGYGRRPADFWTDTAPKPLQAYNVLTARRWLKDAETARQRLNDAWNVPTSEDAPAAPLDQ